MRQRRFMSLICAFLVAPTLTAVSYASVPAAAAAPGSGHARIASGHLTVNASILPSLMALNGQGLGKPAQLPKRFNIAFPASRSSASGTPAHARPVVTPTLHAGQTITPLAPVSGGTFTSFNQVEAGSNPPPDSAIAVGPFQAVVVVNSILKVFTKGGSPVMASGLNTFFKPAAGAADQIFDPRAFFDPGLNRFWVFATSEHDSAGPGDTNRSTHLVALSNSSDVTAGWQRFGIDATLDGNNPTTNWCDYPMLGVDTQAVFLSCNMFTFPANGPSTPDFSYAKVRIITKSQFVNNACCTYADVVDLREGLANTAHSFSVQPARMYGAGNGDGEWMIDSHQFCVACPPAEYEVWHITNVQDCCSGGGKTPIVDSDGIDVGAMPRAPNARQPGGPNDIDTGDIRALFAFWKGGHLSTGQTIACPNGGACVVYSEIDVSGGVGSMSVVSDFIAQQGPDSQDRYFPSVDVNAAGAKTMVYSISGPSTLIGVSAIGIPPSTQCTNCLDGPEISMATGAGTYNQPDGATPPRDRWGDYSSAAPDPDGTGVWVHGEFAGVSNQWAMVVGLTYETQDTTPPVTTVGVVPAPVQTWNNTGVVVTLHATDAGSGVRSISYSVSGAQTIANTTVNGDTASFGLQNEGTSLVNFQATDNWGNQEPLSAAGVDIDKTPPSVTCGAPDLVWHATDVSVFCNASDALSGLANPGDAFDFVSTSVPDGTETANAFTGSQVICDVAGNCATAGPVGPFKIDKKAPVISIVAPDAVTYTVGQKVQAFYGCSDAGSGLATCAGPVPNGGFIDTSTVGVHTFTVAATDAVGNKSSTTVTYIVSYAVCALYDPAKPAGGSTFVFRIELCDANGADVSSATVTVHAVLITPGNVVPSSPVQVTNDFDFIAGIGTSGGYLYVLDTKNLAPGAYALHVTASGDPSDHPLAFTIK